MQPKFKSQSINTNYFFLDDEKIQQIKHDHEVCEMENSDYFIVENAYYKNNYPGTLNKVYTRKAVFDRLHKIIKFLAPDYGIFIFDAFRTLETQGYLFDTFLKEIHHKKPHLTESELQIEVRKYVAHPNGSEAFPIPSHNTGGAIDLCLYDLKTKELLDFGCPIDETEEISSTNFFENEYQPLPNMTKERWQKARENRRLLFHTMKYFDFSNLTTEWWHYDLGDFLWSQAYHTKPIFYSMEDKIL